MSILKNLTMVSIAAASVLTMTACSSNDTTTLIDNPAGSGDTPIGSGDTPIGSGDTPIGSGDIVNGNNLVTINLDGKVVDGYIRKATVCLDLNLDDTCSVGVEPTAISNDDGSYKLELTAEQQANKNLKKAKLLVTGGFDNDTQRRFEGSLSALYDATKTSFFITPISTMVAVLSEEKSVSDAKKEVALMLNLDAADLEKDPVAEAKNGNIEILKKALQVQKTVEVLASAAKIKSSDSKEQISKDIMRALTKGMEGKKSTSLAENIQEALEVVSQKPELKKLMGGTSVANAVLASRGAAVIMAKNVDAAMQDAQGEDGIIAAALTINKTKEKFIEVVKTKIEINSDLTRPIDFSHSSVITVDAYFKNKVSIANIKKELTKNMLIEAGVSHPTDAQAEALLKDKNFNPKKATFTNLNDVILASDDPDLKVIKDKVEKFSDNVESGSTEIKDAIEVVDDVQKVLDSNVSANVDDAKQLVQELRDSVATFYSDGESIIGDVNSSTALGKHAQAVQDNVVPALKDEAQKVKDTLQAVGDMAQNFGDDIQNDFGDQIDSIKSRLNAIRDAFDAHQNSDDWNATTSEGDVIVWKKEGDKNSTETYTLSITNENGTDISGKIPATDFDENDEAATILLSDASSQTLQGSGYKLTLSGLVLDFTNKVGNISIEAVGKLEGNNSAVVNLNKFTATTEADANTMDANSFQNIFLEFDGKIDVEGRILLGQLVVNEADVSQNMLHGKFTGLEGEPVLEGTLEAEADLDKLKTSFDDDNKAYDGWQKVHIVTDPEGKHYFAIQASRSNNEWTDTFYGDTHSYTQNLNLSNGETLTCDVNKSRNYYQNIDTMSKICRDSEGSSDYNATSFNSGYIVDVELADGTKATLDYMGYYYNMEFKTEDDEYVNFFNFDDLSGVSIVDVKKAMNPYDFSSHLNADANVTYNDIRAKLDASLNVDEKEIDIKANSVELSDATNHFKVDALEARFDKKAINRDDELKTTRLDGQVVTEDYNNDESDIDNVRLVKVSNLDLSVQDNDGSTLEIQADAEFSNSADQHINFTFDGHYAYLDTELTGKVDTTLELVKTNHTNSENYYECESTNTSSWNEDSNESYSYPFYPHEDQSVALHATYADETICTKMSANYYSCEHKDYGYNYDTQSLEVSPSYTYDSSYDESQPYKVHEWEATTCSAEQTYTWEESRTSPVGHATVNVSIVPANGFAPFDAELVLNTTTDTLNSTLLLTKGDYKLAMQVDADGIQDDNTTEGVVHLGDSNGVKSVVDFKGNQEIKSAIVTDKDGTPLANFGEQNTGNKWEVTYENGDSESIF